MTPTVRIFESEAAARDAAEKLSAAGFGKNRVLSGEQSAVTETGVASGMTSPPPNPEAMVRAAIDDGLLAGRHISVCVRNLQRGRSLVAVATNFGFAGQAIEIMESCGAVDSASLPAYVPRDPSPFSDLLGIPTLIRVAPVTELKSSSWFFSSLFGLGLLSGKAAPFSSLFGMKLLSERKREWRSSFGLPLLSNNPAPLSSALGMRTLSTGKRSWTRSFGLPLLSRNPAPLSSLLGISTLIKRR